MVAVMGRAEIPGVGQQCLQHLREPAVNWVCGIRYGVWAWSWWGQPCPVIPDPFLAAAQPLTSKHSLPVDCLSCPNPCNKFIFCSESTRVSLWLNWKPWTATDNIVVQAELFAACHCVKFSPIPGNSQPSIVSTAVPSYPQKVPHIVRHYVSHLGWYSSMTVCLTSYVYLHLKQKA